MEELEIRFNDNTIKKYPVGTTYAEIAKERAHLYQTDILAALVDNYVVELKKEAKSGEVEFVDLTSRQGHYIYEKALSFIFTSAAKEILKKSARMRIENSIDKGIYIEVDNDPLTEEKVQKIEDKMRELVEKDLPFTKTSVLRIDAINHFEKIKRMDKVKNLQYMGTSYVSLYKFNSNYDYFYSKMPSSSGVINKFKLNFIGHHGLVITFPKSKTPLTIEKFQKRPLIATKFNEYSYWGSLMGVSNSADLNEILSNGKIDELIKISETLSNNSLADIAQDIYKKRNNIKIVLIGGPSSSGKTTTAKKLAMQLRVKGMKPYQISMDNYFKERKDTPKDKNDNYEFESIDALDLEMFNRHIDELLMGKEIILPEYNFITGKKEFLDNKLKLTDKTVLIIEGLHSLNEKLTEILPRDNKYKIYVSPLTQLNIDDNNYVHTTDVRLLRRIVRDNKFRGSSTSQTLEMWSKVRAGEEVNVFPFQEDVDVIYNTALIYEIGVLKTYAEPLLYSVKQDDPNYAENKRLIKFLNNFLPISGDEIPTDSILREFIGGGNFVK